MIVDAHTHLFDPVHGRIRDGLTTDGGWGTVLCGEERIAVYAPLREETVFTTEMLSRYMDLEGVDKAVLLQGCFYGDQNEVVRAAVQGDPERFAGAMYIAPWDENYLDYYERYADAFAAVKLECSVATGFGGWRDGFCLTDYMDLYRDMEKKGLVLTLDLGAAEEAGYQTEAVSKIMGECPELRIVVCHLGQPRIHYAQMPDCMDAWKRQLTLAKEGNVWFDTASLNAYFFTEIYPYKTASQFFNIALDIAGPEKIMAGSDMPGNSLISTYKQMLYLPRIYGSFLGVDDAGLAAMMGGNAYQIYFGKRRSL